MTPVNVSHLCIGDYLLFVLPNREHTCSTSAFNFPGGRLDSTTRPCLLITNGKVAGIVGRSPVWLRTVGSWASGSFREGQMFAAGGELCSVSRPLKVSERPVAHSLPQCGVLQGARESLGLVGDSCPHPRPIPSHNLSGGAPKVAF